MGLLGREKEGQGLELSNSGGFCILRNILTLLVNYVYITFFFSSVTVLLWTGIRMEIL